MPKPTLADLTAAQKRVSIDASPKHLVDLWALQGWQTLAFMSLSVAAALYIVMPSDWLFVAAFALGGTVYKLHWCIEKRKFEAERRDRRLLVAAIRLLDVLDEATLTPAGRELAEQAKKEME